METKNKEINIVQVKMSRNKSILIIIASICFYFVAVFLWKQKSIDINIVLNQNYFFSHTFFITSAKFVSRYGMGIISFLLAV